MKKLTLAQTIAYRNPEEAQSVLQKYGYHPGNNGEQLVSQLNLFIREHQDKSIDELMAIHPDKEAIEELIRKQTPEMHSDYLKPHHGHHHGHHGHHHGYPREFSHLPHHSPHHYSQISQHHNCCGGGHHNADGFNNCAGCGGKCGGQKYANADGGNAADTAGNAIGAMSAHTFYAVILVVAVLGLFAMSKRDHKHS